MTAVPDANGELHAVGLTAVMGGYEHYWSPRYSTNVVYSVASAPDGGLLPGHVQQAPRLRRRQSPLLVSAEPRMGRRRVSLRPPRGRQRPGRHRPPHPVRRSLQPPVVPMGTVTPARRLRLGVNVGRPSVAALSDKHRSIRWPRPKHPGSITFSRRSPRASTSGATSPGPRRHGPRVQPAAATRACRPRATRRSPRSCPWRISRPTRAPGY